MCLSLTNSNHELTGKQLPLLRTQMINLPSYFFMNGVYYTHFSVRVIFKYLQSMENNICSSYIYNEIHLLNSYGVYYECERSKNQFTVIPKYLKVFSFKQVPRESNFSYVVRPSTVRGSQIL